MGVKILLVEGESDRNFFQRLLKSLGYCDGYEIKCAVPEDHAQKKNTKQGVLNAIRDTYLTQLSDGQLSEFAVILDADSTEYQQGFDSTVAAFQKILDQQKNEIGEYQQDSNSNSSGLIFKNKDGLPNIGLWVMPNNCDDGMLEDWMRKNIVASENDLMQYVLSCVEDLPVRKFKSIHETKAVVATWLAWQEKPNLTSRNAVNLMDEDAFLMQDFKKWLSDVFH
jgi:hypothetical protein